MPLLIFKHFIFKHYKLILSALAIIAIVTLSYLLKQSYIKNGVLQEQLGQCQATNKSLADELVKSKQSCDISMKILTDNATAKQKNNELLQDKLNKLHNMSYDIFQEKANHLHTNAYKTEGEDNGTPTNDTSDSLNAVIRMLNEAACEAEYSVANASRCSAE